LAPQHDQQMVERRAHLEQRRARRHRAPAVAQVLGQELADNLLSDLADMVTGTAKPAVEVLDALHVLLNRRGGMDPTDEVRGHGGEDRNT
jgi:hypothetical protein